MNLLVINLDKSIFKPASASLERLREYSRIVDNIFVIVWTRGNEEPIIINERLFVYPTNSSRKFFYLVKTFILARRIIKKNKIDLIFTQDPFETGLAGWILSFIYHLPLQLQLHTDVFSRYFKNESWLNSWRVIMAGFLIKRADSIRVVSQRIKDSLLNKGINSKKIFVIPIISPFKAVESKTQFISKKKKFIFLTVSRLAPVKNISMQIQAMAEIIKVNPIAELLIVGDGEDRNNLQSLIVNLRLSKSVKMFGWKNNLIEFYNKADAFMLTSNYEGWGMVVIEAANHNLPIIMTDVGCAGEVIKDRESGIIIPIGDKDKLIEAMRELMLKSELTERIIDGASQAIRRLPNKEELLALYFQSWLKAIS